MGGLLQSNAVKPGYPRRKVGGVPRIKGILDLVAKRGSLPRKVDGEPASYFIRTNDQVGHQKLSAWQGAWRKASDQSRQIRNPTMHHNDSLL